MKLYEVNPQADKEMEVRKNGTLRVRTMNLEESKTQQQFADECDINNIISKYKKTRELPLARKEGVYADLSMVPADYHQAQQIIADANDAFMRLPADLRNRFENDPAQLLAFTSDASKYDEGVQLGLYEPKPVPTKTDPQKTDSLSTETSKTKNSKASKNDNSNDE